MEQLGGEAVFQWFLSLAYQPLSVYAAVITLLILSSFGLPLPEEVTLLSSGFIAYVGRTPDQFPPPVPDAAVVDPVLLAIIATLAVFTSDLLVYGIGRRFGPAVRESWLARRLSPGAWDRAERWTFDHGAKVAWTFRFMPGIRFPGHLTCGVVKLPLWQFCLADGIATLISVPTQVLLIAYYGDAVLALLKRFKIVVAILVVVAIVVYLVYWLANRKTTEEDLQAARDSRRLTKLQAEASAPPADLEGEGGGNTVR